MPSHRVNDEALLVGHWPLNGASGVITPDVSGHGYPGTLVNAPTFTPGPQGRQCLELDGATQHVNIGDVLELNAVSAFSICFWMNQDVINIDDTMFYKYLDATHFVWLRTFIDGFLYAYVTNVNGAIRTTAAYALVSPAASWHHVALVYDGAQVAADRLQIFIDAAPMATTILGALPALSADLSAIDATIGAAADSFDGKLYDFRIASCAYSRDEVIEIVHVPVPFAA